MRKAIIDLGTNTFSLLIAEVNGNKIIPFHSEKEGVGLGLGGINENTISEESFKRGLRAIHYFKKVCYALKVDEITAFGTSALRNANNQNEFSTKVKLETDIDIHIIDGNMEAKLIYEGVKHSLEEVSDGIIMDIGGGSTEFIFLKNNELDTYRSFEMGVSRIYQSYEFHDPFKKSDEHRIYAYLDEISGDFFEEKSATTLIGASGSFETFYEMIFEKVFTSHIATEIPFDKFMEAIDEMRHSSLYEREQNPFILPIRKLMGPITAVKIRWLIEKLNINKIIVSPNSLKEGALLSLEGF